ncbi:GNAT family N-acetyltransferase [Natronomonas sp. F2-12]|uniref:GNAT family N-acetyltransferase n=1 Tax=Natronomonas aquatica TaxID=2841590 RepID=A0A9R1CQT0_9EURY|nr:GNAT family N-acetyltransferase [Natronomonas aquatica]MCQ4332190.1 GNAT family N-acetyltransferase [Natronomonas aquatica]
MTTTRPAVPGEYIAVRSILEGALLEVEAGLLRRSSVLVAIEDGRILGALVLRGSEIEAIAVRPKRRGKGVGSGLIREAATRRPRLSAGFDPAVRPFYEALGFEVVSDGGRCRGVRQP